GWRALGRRRITADLFFFFSSRRRHTRFSRDWSSDVCSSDLNGIGNGISLIIFAGIVAEFPVGLIQTFQTVGEGGVSAFSLIVLAVLFVAIVAAVVMVQEGQRRIPVQYAKRVVGRRMYGGQATHIPLRVNNAGVIPVIFASSVLTFPLTLAQFIPA